VVENDDAQKQPMTADNGVLAGQPDVTWLAAARGANQMYPRDARPLQHMRFHQDLVEHTENFGHITWLGHPIWQNVLDLWALQEAIAEIQPAVLLETGTNRGGSALFYAHLFDLIGRGRVVTVDVESSHNLSHPRIDFLIGGSLDAHILATMRAAAESADGPVMAVLDSDHAAAHVAAELEAYAPLITPGSMLLCQDGIIDLMPWMAPARPGPLDAIRAFLPRHPEFEVDGSYDHRFLISHHPAGWLRRRRA
jgi:cephalosporin hydroxylase